MPSKETGDDCCSDESDPYLRFDGPVYDATPRNFIQFIDTVRKESKWCELGLAPKTDRNGNYKPIIKKGLYFGFHRRTQLRTIDMEAIATGKKVTQNPDAVFALLCQGCSYDDFVSLQDDVIAYCECRKAKDREELEAALFYILKAVAARPEDITYANACFELRLRLGDKATIEDELAFYQDDIDCLVHCGRVYEWLKFLLSIKDYVGMDHTVKRIDNLLEALVAARTYNRRYCSQPPEFYVHEKDQFITKTAQLRKRIQAALRRLGTT